MPLETPRRASASSSTAAGARPWTVGFYLIAEFPMLAFAAAIEPLYMVGWNALTMDPLDADSLYLGDASGKLHHSADGGASWQKLTVELPKEGRIRTLACAA